MKSYLLSLSLIFAVGCGNNGNFTDKNDQKATKVNSDQEADIVQNGNNYLENNQDGTDIISDGGISKSGDDDLNEYRQANVPVIISGAYLTCSPIASSNDNSLSLMDCNFSREEDAEVLSSLIDVPLKSSTIANFELEARVFSVTAPSAETGSLGHASLLVPAKNIVAMKSYYEKSKNSIEFSKKEDTFQPIDDMNPAPLHIDNTLESHHYSLRSILYEEDSKAIWQIGDKDFHPGFNADCEDTKLNDMSDKNYAKDSLTISIGVPFGLTLESIHLHQICGVGKPLNISLKQNNNITIKTNTLSEGVKHFSLPDLNLTDNTYELSIIPGEYIGNNKDDILIGSIEFKYSSKTESNKKIQLQKVDKN